MSFNDLVFTTSGGIVGLHIALESTTD